MAKPKPTNQVRVDGLSLTSEVDDSLNIMFARVFSSPEGRALLHYLRGLTTQRSVLPGATGDQALHHGGACWLMNIIDARVTNGAGRRIEPERNTDDGSEQPADDE